MMSRVFGVFLCASLFVVSFTFPVMGHRVDGRMPHGGGCAMADYGDGSGFHSVRGRGIPWFLFTGDGNDAYVSRKDYDAFAKDLFSEMDLDNDGKVTAGEVDKYSSDAKSDVRDRYMFRRLDKNSDGKLSEEEYHFLRHNTPWQ